MIKSPGIDRITMYDTPWEQDYKILDGDICARHYPLSYLKMVFKKHNIALPVKLKGIILTRESEFSSKEIEISEKMLRDVQ